MPGRLSNLASIAKARKPFPKLVDIYRPPKFADDKAKQAYADTVRDFEKVAHATWQSILAENGNPFEFKSAHVVDLFAAAIKVPMGGVDAPPPFQPLVEDLLAPRLSHNTQQDATFIDAPRAAPETVDLNTNPDALAVKASIGILLYQEKKALANMRRLDLLSQQVDAHTKEFAQAVVSGDIKITEKTDPVVDSWLTEYVKHDRFKPWAALFDGSQIEREVAEWEALEKLQNDKKPMSEEQKRRLRAFERGENPNKVAFAKMPERLKTAKTPAINWAQYGVVGDSFEQVHANVLKTLGSDKKPEEIATDGSIKTMRGNMDPRFMEREEYMAHFTPEQVAEALELAKNRKQ